MSKRLLLVALALSLCGCPTAPIKQPQPGSDKELSPGGLGQNVLPGGNRQQAPEVDFSAKRKVIKGTVRMTRQLISAYRLQAVSEGPVAGAYVEVRNFGGTSIVRGTPVTTNAEGAFTLVTEAGNEPLYVRAVVGVGAERVSVYAPVPYSDAEEVTVTLDLVGSMLVQYILDRAKDPRAAIPLLVPDRLGTLQTRLGTHLSDANAPDLRQPTAVFNLMDQITQSDRAIASTLEEALAQGPQPTEAPLPSPTTIVPAQSTPGPTTDDPPIFTGEGPAVTATPKPASYLQQAFTQLQGPAHMAVVRFTAMDEVFMAAADTSRKTVFAFFRDAGSPKHWSASELGVEPVSVALDKGANLYVLGSGKLNKLTVALGPALSNRTTLVTDAAGATAVAVEADGDSVYLGDGEGRVRQFSSAGAPGYTTQLEGPVKGLAATEDGKVYAALASGTVVALAPSGAVENASYATAAGANALSVDPAGNVFVGSANKLVYRVKPGGATDEFLKTPDAVTGVGSLGGYLFLTETNGNLNCLTTADQ